MSAEMDQITEQPNPDVVADVVALGDPMAPFAVVLDHQCRDAIDRSLLLPGQRVLRNPLAPSVVSAATDARWREFKKMGFAWNDETRRQTWQPDLASGRAEAASRTHLAGKFVDSISGNMEEARNGLLPLVHTPTTHLLLPATLWIKSVVPVQGCGGLADRLIDELARFSGLPVSCPLTPEYRELLRGCNKVEVYKVNGSLGLHQCVVVAFVSPFRFERLKGIVFEPLDSARLEPVRNVLAERAASAVPGARFIYLTLGTPGTTGPIGGTESGFRFTMIATPATPQSDVAEDGGSPPFGEWAWDHPTLLSRRRDFIDFVDLLKPMSRADRANAIEQCGNRIRLGGGHVSIDKLQQASHYGRSAVYQAMFDIQDEGRFQVRKNEKGVLCLLRSSDQASAASKPMRRCGQGRTMYYVRMSIICTLTPTALLLQAHAQSLQSWPIVGGAAAWIIGWGMALMNRYYIPVHRN